MFQKKYKETIKRRKDRLLFFIESDVPKEIITNEIDLIRQSYLSFIWSKIKNIFMK